MSKKFTRNRRAELLTSPHRLAPGLEIRASQIQGQGCFATKPFALSAKIADYEGEIISWDEAMHRRRIGLGHCICDLEDGTCIDGRIGGNGTEYINHSCAPNCGLILVQGKLAIYAQRDIGPGSELTVNYLSSLELVEIPCHCQTCVRKTGKMLSARDGLTVPDLPGLS